MTTNLLGKELSTKELYKWTLTLAVPIMIQNLISTLVGTADTVMLGYVGQTAMAASSLANQYTFVIFCIFFGLATGTSVMAAQYYGKKDLETVERIIGISGRFSIIFAALFTTLSLLFPQTIMKIFSSDPETIEIGAQYLRIVSISFVFMGISQTYTSALRSIGKIIFPSVVSVVSLCVNIFLNASFIFGLFGLPKLGVLGVALGTVCARFSEVLLCFLYSIKGEIKFRLKYIFNHNGILTRDFVKISFPAMGNDLIWGLATSVFTAILGHMGNDIIAANAVAIMVVNIGAIAERGFANATTVVIGQSLGANQIEATKKYSKKLLILTIIVAVFGCFIMVGIRPLILKFYENKLSPKALSYLSTMIFMTTYRMIGEGINTCLICGCFRGGGDSRYGFIMDTIMMWGVALPLMVLAAYVFKFPAIWVYFVMTLDEYEKMPFVFMHFSKYKWMKNITRDKSELS